MDRLLQLRERRRSLGVDLYSGDMHLCGAFDIILALLFPAQAPPFPALLGRHLCPWGCCGCARHDLSLTPEWPSLVPGLRKGF